MGEGTYENYGSTKDATAERLKTGSGRKFVH